MDNAANELPLQKLGRQTDFTSDKKFKDTVIAHLAYKKAVERLLNVNDWHEYTGVGSAKFTLSNNLGDDLSGFANEGFYIRIDLPGPGSNAGEGSEWVLIENVKTDGDEHTAEEYLLFTARPVPDPRKTDTTIANFFTDDSTNTFIVRRDGKVITAGVHGRNETPNNENVDLHDKIRNTAIPLMARIGLSGGQWQKLVDGVNSASRNKE